jgi:hypothetical protein
LIVASGEVDGALRRAVAARLAGREDRAKVADIGEVEDPLHARRSCATVRLAQVEVSRTPSDPRRNLPA